MEELERIDPAQAELDAASEGLREALLRLTSPQYVSLWDEIESIHDEIDRVAALGGSIADLEIQLNKRVSQLLQADEELSRVSKIAREKISNLEANLDEVEEKLRGDLKNQIHTVEVVLAELDHKLENPEEMKSRLDPVLVAAIHKRVRAEEAAFAEAISPVIGPAIRHQIRSARQDIIDALYPVIGGIISKAISEEIRELTRKIDAQLRPQIDLRARLELFLNRLRGVEVGELFFRGALPYAIQHIFLIHQETGLLLTRLTMSDDSYAEADTVSAMLTAIRDFVRDSFDSTEGELEEITHGENRILLERGQYCYLAVVLEGVEPQGFSHRIRHVINEINLNYENVLRSFDGDMDKLPDFRPALEPLTAEAISPSSAGEKREPLSKGEKTTLFIALLFAVLMIVGLVFGCIFIIRLWPLVFP